MNEKNRLMRELDEIKDEKEELKRRTENINYFGRNGINFPYFINTVIGSKYTSLIPISSKGLFESISSYTSILESSKKYFLYFQIWEHFEGT
jgi:hypothetical protein